MNCDVSSKRSYLGLVNTPGFFVFAFGFFLALCVFSPLASAFDKVDKPDLMLLKNYQLNQDVTGWLMSEKLDGVRAYWDGQHLVSRQGNIFNAPTWFTKGFPKFALDGELWLARGKFAETVSIVRQQVADSRWQQISYNVFEVPNQPGGLLARLSVLRGFLQKHPHALITIIEQKSIGSNADVEKELKRVTALGGEGLVVRKADSLYQTGRLDWALKVKQKQDAECVVKGYSAGQGKYTGLVGALECEL
ncbi:MAG: DNA ligase, partial [Thiomicrorhabdus sp.]|nr:DNA ligase [Thiomicrorhabdus sp.]